MYAFPIIIALYFLINCFIAGVSLGCLDDYETYDDEEPTFGYYLGILGFGLIIIIGIFIYEKVILKFKK